MLLPKNEFLPYAKFQTAEDALQLINLLKTAQIPYQFEHLVNQLDDLIIGYSLDPMFEIRVESSKFEQVNDLLQKVATVGADDTSRYYLYDFTEEELKNVINNDEEWNAFDQGLARSILEKRESVSLDTSINFNKTYKPQSLPAPTIILGYLLSITIIGVLFGLSIRQNKKVLSDGHKVYTYDNNTRLHGSYMILVALFALTLFVTRKFIS